MRYLKRNPSRIYRIRSNKHTMPVKKKVPVVVKKPESKEAQYLAKLIDEEESHESEESEESGESDESEIETISEEEDKSEEAISEDKADEEEIDIVEEESGEDEEKKEKPTDAPLEWIDDSILEKNDKIILTGDKRTMSDRVTMNEYALILSMRIAQIENGSPIFLKHNPYTVTRDIAIAEIRENANNENGNYPLKILRHSHSNVYEEWKIHEMSIPGIMGSGTIIATGDD